MNSSLYTAEMVEDLWSRLTPGTFLMIDNGEIGIRLVNTDGREGLSFNLASSAEWKDLSTQGFTAEVIEERTGRTLRLLKNQGYEINFFSTFVANLLELAYEIREEESRVQLKQLFSRIRAWQKFMAVRKKNLDKKQQLGIFGELTVLNFLVKNGLAGSTLRELWTGPLKGAHDFKIREKNFLEVKASLCNTPFEIKVTSLEQLDCREDENLFVAALYCCESKNGDNIIQLAKKIQKSLGCKLDSVEFESLLTAVGLNPFEKEDGLFRFEVSALSFADARKLPRILPTTVPGILTASYTIALTNESGEKWTELLTSDQYLELFTENSNE